MRMLITVTIPAAAGNAAIKSGALQRVMTEALERIKPEAAYFTTRDGCRTAFLVADMKDPSQMPWIAEPFFMNLDAAVQFTPVMNAEDLRRGLATLQA